MRAVQQTAGNRAAAEAIRAARNGQGQQPRSGSWSGFSERQPGPEEVGVGPNKGKGRAGVLPPEKPFGLPEEPHLTAVSGIRPAAPQAKEKGKPSPPAPQRFELPSYLLNLEAGGLSMTYGLTGDDLVRSRIAALVGQDDGALADIEAELAGRPESFFGAGRAFPVPGTSGAEWYDVTVSISRAPGDRPPLFQAGLPADVTAQPLAELEDPEGKDTKLDVHHTSAATVSSTGGGSSSKGAGGVAFGLAPVVPGLWLGGAVTGNVQPWQSSRESRHQRNVAEIRVLRSDKGTVEVHRKVRYTVRVRKVGDGSTRTAQVPGGLTHRVPVEHLTPAGTGGPGTTQRSRRPVGSTAQARAVSLSDSLAPIGVTETAAPHEGGGGLFDTVASVMHPAVTSPGAPGRARLYAATATATVLEDLPRLLRDGVVGEDLVAKDGKTVGSYHLRATLDRVVPAWGTGNTQLRNHQQAQTSVAQSAGKGRALQAGAGPAIGVGAVANAAVVRGGAMPVGGARKARGTAAEQAVSSRQGAEVRGAKALYFGRMTLTAEGTGQRAGDMALRPGPRVARHSMDVWFSLRADEAKALGLPLPQGMNAGEFTEKPRTTDAHGAEVEVERFLPFGGKGANVALSRLDTGPMVRTVRRLFATDPRLAGYLPAFGTDPAPAEIGQEEAETQRQNYRALMAAMSETNLRVNKDQLLSTGIRVRLRRKTSLHAHDVQLLFKGALGETAFEGDIKDWSVRSHAGVTSNSQSGRGSSRSIGGLLLGQARVVPGIMTMGARYEHHRSGARRNQAGPTSRTDIVSNGSDSASAFTAAMRLDVEVTMTSRPRKLLRGVTPGTPGRDVPEAETVAYLNLGPQDIRLLTPTEFTVDRADMDRIAAVSAARRSAPAAAEHQFEAKGIGDLAELTPRPSVGELLTQWQLVESLDGEPVRDLALQLLSRAAARDKGLREDPALATEGLAPRQAIEERFGERAIQGALRQAASAGWVVKNLTYPRRLAGLNGAVGTRISLANPKFLHLAQGPGTETFVLGGHQSTGQKGKGTSHAFQYTVGGVETGPSWRAGQGLAVSHTSGRSNAEALTVAGTVERNAHTPKKGQLYLVQCDVLLNMVAEVKVTGGGPYVTKGVRTLPAAAAVWLTEAQLPESVRQEVAARTTPPADHGLTAPHPSGETQAESSRTAAARTPAAHTDTATATTTTTSSAPALAANRALGFGMIEDLPDFVPLLTQLRGRLARGPHAILVERLLPRRQTDDRNDNVQRLLRVLDRDGSAGLLSSAMDGGVTVELLDDRRTPYWAVFKLGRAGDGMSTGPASDGRDMEYITSAVAQQATSRDKGHTTGVEGVLAGSLRPENGTGGLRNVGGAGGMGYASGHSRRDADVRRGQLGMKSVADSSLTSEKVRVPIRASLELYKGDKRLARADLGRTALTHRILRSDLEALSRVRMPVEDHALASRGSRDGGATAFTPAWRDAGVKLPLEAQVNGFQGAPQVRELVSSAVRAAGGGDRFRAKGQAAAYALDEAVSTEWMISALPLLTAAGADLPPVYATGLEGQDLRASVHARLRNGQVLGLGGKMTFETLGQSDLAAPRPTQADGQSSTDHSRTARALVGAGVLNATEFRLNQLIGNAGGAGGTNDAMANSSGSMPVTKPKMKAVLVQFTLDVRVQATVTGRARDRAGTAVRELTLPHPVVIRMPEPVVRHMLATQGDRVKDDGHHLDPAAPPPPTS
ncbi:hypothetical protein EJ357_37995 [Streptomyces cyaneochromogenes]|uniref:Uncharacterized protein n=1 Tax=Streptomyces cyaneochromogenes TaxID=2496836 RepID=A0A3Q9EYW4_9ACTN|nr:hypothetical protein [Streptomyces cyaneochromogenes]AZQ38535.1 hypothetical protein EJ357_37995 [Streptomyces cyaneochromogenes]